METRLTQCRSSCRRCSIKKVFLKILQFANLQENTCVFWRRCFLMNFRPFVKTYFSQNTTGRLPLTMLSVVRFAALKIQVRIVFLKLFLQKGSIVDVWPVSLRLGIHGKSKQLLVLLTISFAIEDSGSNDSPWANFVSSCQSISES